MSKWRTSEEKAEMGLSRSIVRKIDVAAHKLVNSFAFGRTPYLYINDKIVGKGFFLLSDVFFLLLNTGLW